jgi:dTDP-4-amino-4,6-dideoxygalactose transaminase
VPIHLQPAYQDLGYREEDFPVSEAYAGEVLSLPMYAELTDEQVRYVARCVNRILADGDTPAGS